MLNLAAALTKEEISNFRFDFSGNGYFLFFHKETYPIVILNDVFSVEKFSSTFINLYLLVN